MGSPPIKVGWLCKSKSLRPIALDSWNFLCRFQIDMALSGNFFGAMQCVLPGEKTPNTTFAAPVRLRLVSKIHKKLIEFFHKSVILTVAAKMGEKAFFSIWKSFSAYSCWYFGDFPCNSIILVTFPLTYEAKYWRSTRFQIKKLQFFSFVQKITWIP